MALLYFSSGIGGNLLSVLCVKTNSVGASTAINGILTGLLAIVLVNWNAFSASE